MLATLYGLQISAHPTSGCQGVSHHIKMRLIDFVHHYQVYDRRLSNQTVIDEGDGGEGV